MRVQGVAMVAQKKMTTYLLLIRDEMIPEVQATISSIRHVCRMMGRADQRVLGACFMPRTADLRKTLTEGMDELVVLGDATVEAIDATKVCARLPTLGPIPGVPGVADLVSAASLRVRTECIVLATPGEELGPHQLVERALGAVDADPEVVVLPENQLSATGLPLWAALSTIALQSRGIVQSAIRGLAVMRKTSLFGGTKYVQDQTKIGVHDVPWLIATIAFGCQSGSAFGVRLVHV